MERERIGVIIRSFEAKALVALKYLVLAQNLQQESFEFEILPEPAEDAFLDRLDSKVPQKRQELESEAKGFIARYKLWLTSDAVAYGLQCDMPDQVVFVTALKFSDRYYLTGEANWAILALGYWERSMAPPSVVEFALTLLSEVAIDTVCSNNFPPRHHATYAKLAGQSRSYPIKKVLALDNQKDLALLRISGVEASPLWIGNSCAMEVGDTVYVVGNPRGFEGTFSQGIVSGIRKVKGNRYLQITAAISEGSSGGPILNESGEVIGIAVASVREGQNLNFAVSGQDLEVMILKTVGAGFGVDVAADLFDPC